MRRLLAVTAILTTLPATAAASTLPVRTFAVTALAGPAVGLTSATRPAISADGSTIAVVGSTGSGPDQVYAIDVLTGRTRLVSSGPDGSPANATAGNPALSADGRTVAFTSTATNLVPGAPGSRVSVYARRDDGAVVRVSRALGGAAVNGSSADPAVSGDGSTVAFTSFASNLVRGDDNQRSDVFAVTLPAGPVRLVSAARRGGVGDRGSSTPALSRSGRYVSFASTADDLTKLKTPAGGIFVRDLVAGRTEAVSVSDAGQPQNRPPTGFAQVSSISADGRFVAFDAVAANLVAGDGNRRSDVFVRDRRRRTTRIVSQNAAGFQGNNDSFSPSISADGRHVVFESLATNLARGGGPRENVYQRDLKLGLTAVMNVRADGGAPGPETVSQLLQRPSLSQDGAVVAFMSSAAGLFGRATGKPQAFVRLAAPPQGTLLRGPLVQGTTAELAVGADDPQARRFVCQVDRRTPFACLPGTVRIRGLSRGTHRIRVWAGGPGLQFDPDAVDVTVRVKGAR